MKSGQKYCFGNPTSSIFRKHVNLTVYVLFPGTEYHSTLFPILRRPYVNWSIVKAKGREEELMIEVENFRYGDEQA